MIRRSLGPGVALGTAAFLVLLSSPSHAADEITIDHVASADGTVSVLLAVDGLPPGTSPDLSSVSVTLDGATVEASATPVKAGEIERTTVLALDASRSMQGERIAAAKAAANAFIDAAPADVKIGLVTFAGEVADAVAPTTDHKEVAAAVDAIDLSRQTFLYDGIAQAMNLSGEDGARSVLVLSDGADTGSKASLDHVTSQAEESSVIVDVVSLDQASAHAELLSKISESSGGKVVDADSEALSEAFTAQADALASQLQVEFPSPDASSPEASLEVSLVADDVTYTDSAFVTLDAAVGGPQSVDAGKPLVGKTVMLLGALALGLGLAVIVAAALGAGRAKSETERRLSAYLGGGGPTGGSYAGVAQVTLKEQAVALSGRVVKGDFETKISQKLSGAGSSMVAAEWILLHAAVAIGSAFIGFVLGGPALGVLSLVVGAISPWIYLKIRHGRRLASFNAQMPEVLGLMAGGLQAGLSLPQAVDTVVREGHEPIAGELRRALIEQRLGVDIAEALEGVSIRMNSDDFAWVVMAIRIQREVGGNLAEILNTVADTLREREYLRRQVRALSAEGRLSGYILTALPPLIAGYMMVANPGYIRPLYTTAIGYAILGLAAFLLAIGGFAMSRLARVEV